MPSLRLVADVDMNAYSFKSYGKEFAKQNKMSPDSFIQMAMQLAFYRLVENYMQNISLLLQITENLFPVSNVQ